MRFALRALFFALCLLGPLGSVHGATGEALLLEVEDAIGPAVSDFVVRGIENGEESDAVVAILRMDTPGGLDSAMREIIKKIMTSEIPVVTYVAPGGSRAASAGTYILYASHIAAMAPATNLGAATPVQISGGGLPFGEEQAPAKPKKRKKKPSDSGADEEEPDSTDAEDEAEPAADAMDQKIVNDAVAYIRGLAKARGRNAEWAEKAVREAESLTSEDALEAGVIDILAEDLDDLLEQMHGRTVTVLGQEQVLETAGIEVVVIEPDWRSRLLAIITNPNVAYILMLLGVYGLFFELYNPGTVLPGVVGAVCLLLALYAFQVLPVNYAGLALILLGLMFIVAEAFMPSFGALGIGGAIAFIVGSLILMDTDVEGYTLSIPLVVAFAIVSGAVFITVAVLAAQQRKRPVVSGAESMVGSLGEVVESFEDRGRVRVQGEIWTARTSSPVRSGERVRVRALDGLVALVEPFVDEKPEEK